MWLGACLRHLVQIGRIASSTNGIRDLPQRFSARVIAKAQDNDWTGTMLRIRAGTVDANGYLNPPAADDAQTHDELGNVVTREQLAAANGALVKGTFTYDALNRL